MCLLGHLRRSQYFDNFNLTLITPVKIVLIRAFLGIITLYIWSLCWSVGIVLRLRRWRGRRRRLRLLVPLQLNPKSYLI